jgi:hypothetical protein
VTRITRTDDPDLAVTFDDLAEFTSALHRRSNFHFSTPKFYWFCLKNSFILSPCAVFHVQLLRNHFLIHSARTLQPDIIQTRHKKRTPTPTRKTIFQAVMCDAIQTKLDAFHRTARFFRCPQH